MHLKPSPRTALAALALLALLGSAGGCSQVSSILHVSPPAVPLPLASPVAAPASGALIGIYRPPAPFDRTPLDSYSSISSKRLAIVMWYQQWGDHAPNIFDPAMSVAVYQHAAVPMISWEPWDPGSNPHQLADPSVSATWTLTSITNGSRDNYLQTWAREIKKLGGPIMLRPLHEMNGNWYPWCGTVNGNTPAEYIAAWRHIHDVFARQGATNVTWVWSVNHVSKPTTPDNAWGVYYPGDAYVDWVAVSGFNPGGAGGSAGPSFDNIFAKPLAYLKTLGKPIAIGETSAVGNSASKSAWIADMYSQILKHPEIKAVLFYDAVDTGVKFGSQDWRMDSDPRSLKAYVDGVSNSYFVGGPVPALSAWDSSLSAAQRQEITTLRRVY